MRTTSSTKKYLIKIDEVELDPSIKLNQNGPRNHDLKIKKKVFKTNITILSF